MHHLCPTCYQPLPPSMDITISLDENCLIWKGKVVHLTPSETVIMYCLQQSGEKWLPKEEMMKGLYGKSRGIISHRILNVFITKLRRKFRSEDIPITIKSQWTRNGGTSNKGYRLEYGF